MATAQQSVFAKVLIGVDGLDGGRDAIALGRMLSGAHGSLVLGHVHNDGDDPGLPFLEGERQAADVDAELATVAAMSVGSGLHSLVAGEHADLLVVGSSHRSLLGRVFVSNDTRSALNGAGCAIAVAPRGYAHTVGELKTIGVGYDESLESQAAVAIARELAQQSGAALKALQVVPLPNAAYAGTAMVPWGGALDAALTDAKQTMGALDGIEGDAVLGVAGEELAAFGAGVDLLVVGSRGYGPVKSLILGSTSAYLAGSARCPLLVLPRVAGAA